ncbi:MAG TPA: cell division protein ZipA C-terminal FtsZ-binding domain-containing protein [Gallionella sp.]|nr:cell division protein ZipA C-terminal FtsZ-binding domain-containing protein [Gallionella sp.]
MSELQAILLAIGLGVIVVIYILGWWQQRQHSRKFDKAFKVHHADALYQDDANLAASSGRPLLDRQVVHDMDAQTVITDETRQAAAAGAGQPVYLDEVCAVLDMRSDFIVELHLAEVSPAAVLDGLWQRKFDFDKPVQVCGLMVQGGQWERAVADSQTLYARFRIALQLVNRGGVISAARLADFRDLVLGIARQIKADTNVPDLETAQRNAVALDEFCAEVDQMVGVNLVPPGGRSLNGSRIAQVAALHGMTLESDGAFHLLNTQGESLLSLVNQNNQPFQHHHLPTLNTAGITLLLDVPRMERPAQQFDQMMLIARELAKTLQTNVVDDNLVVLNDTGIAQIRTRIVEVETKMSDNAIIPGSLQARRLFA